MPVVTSVHTAYYSLPRSAWWHTPIADHGMAIDAIELVTCEVHTDDGATGMGYTYALGHGGYGIHAFLASELAPQLVGLEVDRPEPVWERLWARSLRYGRGGAVSVALGALDTALWDLAARRAGLPLVRFIGERRSSVAVYGSSIDLGYSNDELEATVADWMGRGFGAVKVKVGRPLRDDLERLRRVRSVIGDDVHLMVDANNGWQLPEAIRRFERFREFDLTWIEEPLVPDDINGHRRLQRSGGAAVAAGETLFSVADFQRYFSNEALTYVQADVGRVGGITPWLKVATLAEAHDLPMAPHFLHDLHVHLICAVPNGSWLEYLPLLDAVMEEPLQVERGLARPPQRAGHGIRFNSRVTEHLRARATVDRDGVTPS
jgi:L-alanine-DL-glutamate epimerase-like enolase superfamily enzyme